jgi:hypothetical protein
MQPAPFEKSLWSEQDAAWERAVEQFAAAVAGGDYSRAAMLADAALMIAQRSFDDGDPRRAAALANQAMCVGRHDPAKALAMLRQATAAWRNIAGWMEGMRISPAARSSIFHMRMEQKHRKDYSAAQRARWVAAAKEAEVRLTSVDLATAWDCSAAGQALDMWQAMRPAAPDDTRRLCAAACLMLPGLANVS